MSLHTVHDPRDLQLRPRRTVRVKELYDDPFNPLLLESPSVELSLEQQRLIQLILDNACSDTMFAKKAYASIWYVLTHGNDEVDGGEGEVEEATFTGVNPTTVVAGAPAFDLHALGTGFTASNTIQLDGVDSATTLISPTDLVTSVTTPAVEGSVAVTVTGTTGSQTLTVTPIVGTFGKK